LTAAAVLEKDVYDMSKILNVVTEGERSSPALALPLYRSQAEYRMREAVRERRVQAVFLIKVGVTIWVFAQAYMAVFVDTPEQQQENLDFTLYLGVVAIGSVLAWVKWGPRETESRTGTPRPVAQFALPGPTNTAPNPLAGANPATTAPVPQQMAMPSMFPSTDFKVEEL
jgi:hypothetical protein